MVSASEVSKLRLKGSSLEPSFKFVLFRHLRVHEPLRRLRLLPEPVLDAVCGAELVDLPPDVDVAGHAAPSERRFARRLAARRHSTRQLRSLRRAVEPVPGPGRPRRPARRPPEPHLRLRGLQGKAFPV